MSYASLHTHTDYSLLDGHGKINNYMQKAAEYGLSGMAITDHGNLGGWLDWYDAGEEYGVNAILGCELYQAHGSRFDEEMTPDGDYYYHLTAMATDNVGYQNLMQISSKSFLEGQYKKPRVDFDLLDQHSEGLVILSGCLSGIINKSLMRGDFDQAVEYAAKFRDIVGKDRFFIEVMNHKIEEELFCLPHLVKIAEKIDVPVVATLDSHYVEREDSYAHDVLLAVGTGATIDDEDRFEFKKEEFYLRTYEEALTRFEKEWVDNTNLVAEMNEVSLEKGKFYFPPYDIPEEFSQDTPDSHLERLTWEGARKRYGDPLPEQVIERIEYELMVIRKLGFSSYFLVVSDILRWGKGQKIRIGPGRGSAAGSCVSYCLDITNLDPLHYNLIFERFLIPEGVEYDPEFPEEMPEPQQAVEEFFEIDRLVFEGGETLMAGRN